MRALVLGLLLLVNTAYAQIPPKFNRPIRTVIIHHTAAEEKTVDQIRRGHLARDFKDIAYHYIVFPNGEIKKGRNIHEVGAGVWGKHAGAVEIVIIGKLHKHSPTKSQWLSATQLAAKVCLQEGIPYWRVVGHNEFAAKGHGTLCPAISMKEFRLQVIKEEVVLWQPMASGEGSPKRQKEK